MNKLSIIFPSYLRPTTTAMMLDCISRQTFRDWELIFIGDGCPVFDKIVGSKFFKEFRVKATGLGATFNVQNLENHTGSAAIPINIGIKECTGEFLLFVANDDFILDTHFENYVSGIDNTKHDLVYFNSYLNDFDKRRLKFEKLTREELIHECKLCIKREAVLRANSIGHSEIIVRSSKAKIAQEHTNKRGHDWFFIKHFIDSGCSMTKMEVEPTYFVAGVHIDAEQPTW